ncbi:MAG: hypothetical protein LBL84_01235 [Candidatus Nomurabacteria bacterium]|jgi:hypothetical protein|nr:hypothetical protein [Candidatus Nomurabacteria bacterium]
MRIVGKNVSVRSGGEVFFDSIGFSFTTGELSIVATDDRQKAVAFSMLVSGRLRNHDGTISLNSSDGQKRQSLIALYEIRKVTAVPYVPKIGEPDEFLKLWRVLKEEFLFADKNVSKKDILDFIAQETDGQFPNPAGLRVKDLPNAMRLKVFTKLAAMRPDVKFIFVTLPEKYGGLPNVWFNEVKKLQTKDNTIVLITSKVVVEVLNQDYYDLDDGMRLCKRKAGGKSHANCSQISVQRGR